MLGLRKLKTVTDTSDFYDRCTSLFLGFESGHMGSDMYHHHDSMRSSFDAQGRRRDELMSGTYTWDQHAKFGTVPQLSRQAFRNSIEAIGAAAYGLPLIEYGPGSIDDAGLLLKALNSKLYLPVDLSHGIIAKAAAFGAGLKNCQVRPKIMNFFADRNAPLLHEPALAVLLGLTITNIPGPVPKAAPATALVKSFTNLAQPISHSGGYLLISTHDEQHGIRNQALYDEVWHRNFGVNFLYRMQAELPVSGFNPDYFEYKPVWHPQCSLLAHTVRATRDQAFFLGDDATHIVVKAGDQFHYNNSFKYETAFFETCAARAGLQIAQKWRDEHGMMMYLFAVPGTH